ncbi:MAG: hypothetical protein ABL996_23385 [Micropepsaceae bacterium]
MKLHLIAVLGTLLLNIGTAYSATLAEGDAVYPSGDHARAYVVMRTLATQGSSNDCAKARRLNLNVNPWRKCDADF